MKLSPKWHPGFWRKKLQPVPDTVVPFDAGSSVRLDDLQARLNSWSDLWTQETDPAVRTEAQRLVAERLAHWLERCFGQHAHDALRVQGSQISLASSTPMFTAFLGRRATRELSRQVLRDI